MISLSRRLRPSLGTLTSAALLAAAGAATMLAPATAEAQVVIRAGGPSGGPMGGGGSISRSSLERYSKLLGLTDEQKEAAKALHEGYAAESRSAGEQMRKDMEAIQAEAKDGDFSVFREKMPEVARKNAERSGAIEKTFLKDLQSILTEQQQQAWPRVERLRRREQFLRFGMVSGSSVDLINLVDSMRLPQDQTAKVASTLDEYEQAMDRLLQDSERMATERFAKAKPFDPADMEGMQAAMKADREQAIKVRELNQRYARLLASQLPDDQRAKLEDLVKARSFRQIYGKNSLARRLDAAEKLGDLTADQKERLKQLRDSYKNTSKPLNDKWASALEQAENEGKTGFPFMMMGGGEQDGPLTDARKARKDLDTKTDDQLASILSKDQMAKLPKQNQRGEMGDFGDMLAFVGDDGAEGVIEANVVEHVSEDGSNVVRLQTVVVGAGSGGGEGGNGGQVEVHVVGPQGAQAGQGGQQPAQPKPQEPKP